MQPDRKQGEGKEIIAARTAGAEGTSGWSSIFLGNARDVHVPGQRKIEDSAAKYVTKSFKLPSATRAR